MKKLHFILSALLLMGFTACGDDSNDYQIGGKGSSTPIETDPRQEVGPAEAKSNIEFPAIKGGNSEIIIHRCILNSTTGEQGINYSLEWDHQKKATRWVCYKMYYSINVSNWNRNNWANGDPWDYDPNVSQSEQQATYSELSNSKPPLPNSTYYQKGHILPSADRLGSKEANGQTYYMTNIYPQVPNLNEKIWAQMEAQVRTWANKCDTLYVCKGGTIDNDNNILDYTKGGHIVPKYFYMALLSKKGDTFKAMAFWIEHIDPTSWPAIKNYAITIQQLEKNTGIDFFCNLPNDIEKEVEEVTRTQMLKDWGLN